MSKFCCIFNDLRRKPAFNTYFNSLAYGVSQTLIHNKVFSKLKDSLFLRDKDGVMRFTHVNY